MRLAEVVRGTGGGGGGTQRETSHVRSHTCATHISVKEECDPALLKDEGLVRFSSPLLFSLSPIMSGLCAPVTRASPAGVGISWHRALSLCASGEVVLSSSSLCVCVCVCVREREFFCV